MFSQFRQAVENLAQQSQDNPDVPVSQSSVQLAENAILNIRKSIVAQRTTSPTRQSPAGNPRPRSASPGPSSTPKSTTDSGLRKTTLEERLRASFAASESPVASPSARRSPTPPVPVIPHPLASDSSGPAPDTVTPAPVGDFVEAGTCNGTHDALASSVTPQDYVSVDTAHKDPTADPHVDATPTQDEPPPAHTEPQQCAQNAEVVEESTEYMNPQESVRAEPEPTISEGSRDFGIGVLQERLKLVEQRFADVSTSFKQLQAERRDIDAVITELTPLQGCKDISALREHLTNINMKVELGQDDLQRLNGKLMRQEERLEELQDVHRLEIASRSNQIEKLQQQLSEAEALISASQSTALQTQQDSAKRDSDIELLRAEVSKVNEIAKEEEEKRVKAISLLKTVRQKLVKAEKERDDALRELNEAKEKSLEDKDKDRAERDNLERAIGSANAEREKAVTALRAQFDKDIASARDRAEREIQISKKQFDAEMNALKTSYSAEISTKRSRISTLENTVTSLTSENRSFFEQLELRQAELESSQCHAESLQAQNTELQFQLKELQERITLLNDEIGELRGEHETRSQISGISAEEVSQLVSSVEFKYEAKLSELKRTLTTAEKERTEAEANWSRKLTEKAKESEELKCMLQSSVQLREQDEDLTGALKAEIEKLQAEAQSQQARLYELQANIDVFKDTESNLRQSLSDATARADDSDKQLQESKSREAQFRTQNKTLRDELRKVQNSVTVLERQRNPGVGYWSSRTEATESRTSISSLPDGTSSGSATPARNSEDINYEYLRNVILQFLEHKEMRPNLVRVLSTILRFTPQETRRLMSKV